MPTKLLVLVLVVGLGPASAWAQRRSPLEGAPAVRRKLELRARRAELAGGFGFSHLSDFFHAVVFNLRGAYHFNDFLGASFFFGLNVSPGFETGLQKEIVKTLPNVSMDIRTPSKDTATGTMNKISQAVAVQGEVTPLFGKFALFGKLFFNYDMYAFIGPGFLNLTAREPIACPSAPGGEQGGICSVTGFKVGPNFGVGAHAFVNNWLALNLEFRDIMVLNNPAGRDANGDKRTNSDDLSWDSNYFVAANVALFLPTSVKFSD